MVVLPYPDSAVAPAEVHVQARGFGRFADHVALGREGERLITLVAGARIVGTLSDVSGDAAVASLRLRRMSAQTDESVLRTTARGDFLIEDLDAGQYELDIAIPKRGMQRLTFALAPGQDAYLGTIDVSASATWAGRVQGANNRFVQGARVRLLREGMIAKEAPEGLTDSTGYVEVSSVMPGEYEVELFVPQMGWQRDPGVTVTASTRMKTPGALRFLGSDCSVRVLFDGHPEEMKVPYSIGLPVSDALLRVEISGAEERYYPSVPCMGTVLVRRIGGQFSIHTAHLSAGESTIVVPYVEVGTREVQVLVAGKPLSGWHVWAIRQGSAETVLKDGVENVTDDSGKATVVMSAGESTIVYLERDSATLVVGEAVFSPTSAGLQINLPDRHMAGVARDENGSVLGGAYIGGTRAAVGGAAQLAPSAVTQFKVRSNPDGSFEIPGVAPGEWRIHFTSDTEPRRSASRSITLEPSARGVTRVDITLNAKVPIGRRLVVRHPPP